MQTLKAGSLFLSLFLYLTYTYTYPHHKHLGGRRKSKLGNTHLCELHAVIGKE